MNSLFPDIKIPKKERTLPPKVPQASKPYRPSNSSEGEYFMEGFCYQCAKWVFNKDFEDNDCKHGIPHQTQIYKADHKKYPKWWVEDLDSKNPRCLLFRQK